jgi:hypothetical protein
MEKYTHIKMPSIEKKDSDTSNNDDMSGQPPPALKTNNYDLETDKWIERTDINKITLECMMNKKHYKTYLEKTNPEQLKESLHLQNKIASHSFLIENIFDNLLEHSKNSIKGQTSIYNNEIQRAFNSFIRHAIEYIEETEELDIESTPETIIEQQLKKDYGEIEPLPKTEKRPDFFTPHPLAKSYTHTRKR